MLAPKFLMIAETEAAEGLSSRHGADGGFFLFFGDRLGDTEIRKL